ncbi:hypothetical protein PINS_up023451 [Pythium insidiosum]|nr:hypothetical protein PINS_up023451 [Pythium insidiosum]
MGFGDRLRRGNKASSAGTDSATLSRKASANASMLSSVTGTSSSSMDSTGRKASNASAGSSGSASVSISLSLPSQPQQQPPQRQQIDIRYAGVLLHKRGMLKGYERRYCFLVAPSAELFAFKDERAFREWLALGLPLRASTSKSSPLLPTPVCTVLRADRAGDSSALDRSIAVISGDDSKCSSFKFLTETAEDCDNWIDAFHAVQLMRRDERRGTTTAATLAVPQPRHHHSIASDPTKTEHSSSTGSRLSDLSDSQSQHSSQSASTMYPPAPSYRHAAPTPTHVASNITAAAPPPATAANAAASNVVLFVPAAGSTFSVSDAKLAAAKKELEELVARGGKRPTRSGMDRHAAWRYGVPEYILSDLEYLKGKQRDHDATPLESYAEACCQTFLMEAAHKATYRDWVSVRQDYFYLQVNDGEKIPGHAIREHDLFGMLHLDDLEVDMDLRDGEERKDPRAILAEAFPDGFPMEVLEVFTQPPDCYFSWRHWGRFTGRYRGARGDGTLVELRGFGQMHIDGGRMLNLRLFFKQRDLFDQLNRASAPLRPQSRSRATSHATQLPEDLIADFTQQLHVAKAPSVASHRHGRRDARAVAAAAATGAAVAAAAPPMPTTAA